MNTHFLLTVLTELGDGKTIGLIAIVSAIYLYIAKEDKAALALVVSYTVTAVVITVLKLVLGSTCHTKSMLTDFQSPSGHTALALSVYTIIGIIISTSLSPRLQIIPILGAITVALLIGFSRILLGAHNIFEVLLGLLIGGFIVFAVHKKILRMREVHSRWPILLLLLASIFYLMHVHHLPAVTLPHGIELSLAHLLRHC